MSHFIVASRRPPLMKKPHQIVCLLISIVYPALNFPFCGAQDVVVQARQRSDIVAVAVSPDNTLLASAAYSEDRIIIWDLRSRRQMRTITTDSNVTNLAFNRDGSIVAIATSACTISLFNPESGQLIRDLQPSAAGVQFDLRAGHFVQSRASESGDSSQPSLRPVNFNMPLTFGVNGDLASATPFVSNGNLLWEISIWDTSGNVKHRLFQSDPHEDGGGAITALEFSPDGKWISSGRFDGSIELWNLPTEERLKLFTKDSLGNSLLEPTSLAIDPSKRFLVASSSQGGEPTIIDLISGSTKQLPVPAHIAMFSRDGSTLILGGDHAMNFLNSRTLVQTRAPIEVGTPSAYIHTVTALTHDVYVVTAGTNFFFLAPTTGQSIPLFESRAKPPAQLALESDNSTLLIAIHNHITQWDLKSGSLLGSQITTQGDIVSLDIAPDNAWFIVLSRLPSADNRSRELLEAYELPSGTPIWSHVLDSSESPCISPSGKYVAILEARATIRVFDSKTGAQTDSIRVAQGLTSAAVPDFGQDIASVVYSISFVSDTSIAATGSNPARSVNTVMSGTLSPGVTYSAAETDADPDLPALQVWNTMPNQRIFASATKEPPLMAGPMAAISVAPGAGLAATAYPEGATIHLWDLNRKIELPPLTAQGRILQFDNDGTMLASGTTGGEIRLDDFHARTTREVSSGSGPVSQLRFSRDGKTLIVVGDDGGVQLRNVSDLTLRATIFFSGDRSFIVTPENYYFAAAGLFDFLSFRYQNKVYSVDQFDLQFNRPDKVLQQLGSSDTAMIDAYKSAYQNRIEKLHIVPAHRSSPLPTLRVDSDLPIYTSNKTVHATIHAADAKSELAEIHVYDDGVPVFGEHGISILALHRRTYSLSIPVELVTGTNHLQFSVMDRNGVESLRQPFDITLASTSSAPRILLICIGVADYADSSQSLHYPAKDATDFAQFFVEKWPQQLVQPPVVLVNQNAKRAAIVSLNREVLKKTSPDDIVIMLMAGHGVLDRNLKYYFAPYDMNFARYDAAGIDLADIQQLFDNIPARRKLVLLDTCHAGEVEFASVPASRSATGGALVIRPTALPANISKLSLDEAFIDLRRSSGLFAIGASEGTQSAIETSTYRNGTFTFALLEALGRNSQHQLLADSDHDGTVTVSELRDYVGKRVDALTGGQQVPLLWSGPDEYDFDLIRSDVSLPAGRTNSE